MFNNDNNEKKGLSSTVIVLAIALFVVVLMINFAPLSSFLSIISSIVAPIVIGGAIAYALNPILKFLEFIVFKKLKSKQLTRVLSLILTYVYALLIITLIVAVIVPQLTQSVLDLGSNYDVYIDKTIASFSSIASEFENINVTDVTNFVSEIITESGDLFQTILDTVLSYGSALFTAAKNLLLGFFISIYILISKERLYAVTTKTARAFMSNKMFNACMRYVRIANSTFGRFFIGKLFDSAIVFFLTLMLLSLFEIPHAFFIAIIVGVLNIIHFFGIILAIVFAAFIVLIAAPSKLLLLIVIMIVIQQIDSNIIAPKILGSSAGISSLGVITAVIVMGSCFGIIGMIIGVPIFAIIIAIVKDFLDKKLAKKNLPTNTSSYYDDPDYSSENEEYKPLIKHLLDPLFKRFSKRLNATISKDLKKDDLTEDDFEILDEDDNDIDIDVDVNTNVDDVTEEPNNTEKD